MFEQESLHRRHGVGQVTQDTGDNFIPQGPVGEEHVVVVRQVSALGLQM